MDPTVRDELLQLFAAGVESPLPDAAFDALALRAFRSQFESNAIYRGFCESRGAAPGGVRGWEEVPPVPTRAFKELRLVSGNPDRVERVFRTSGTTRGSARRGEHHVLDLALYDASSLPNLRTHLLPDEERIRILALVPDPKRLPDSSLSYMVGRAVQAYGAEGSGFFADPVEGVEVGAFRAALDRAEDDGAPVLVIGTAFAFVHWLERASVERVRHRLPGGSRIMETGGFKGRSRALSRDSLYGELESALGIPSSRIVNEYGMTELLSQFYEPVLIDGAEDRRHRSPPWVRTRVLDPVSLEPVAHGSEGILCHFDLANLGSICHVLTEDRGVEHRDGFRVIGRSPGAEPRGCSLAMEGLLAGDGGREGGG